MIIHSGDTLRYKPHRNRPPWLALHCCNHRSLRFWRVSCVNNRWVSSMKIVAKIHNRRIVKMRDQNMQAKKKIIKEKNIAQIKLNFYLECSWSFCRYYRSVCLDCRRISELWQNDGVFAFLIEFFNELFRISLSVHWQKSHTK